MPEFILLFSFGIFVGAFGTIIGAGGGFIIVPFLMYAYNASPQLAVGTSLCIISLNALSGTFSYAKQKRIDYRTGIIFALATIPGAYLGAYILQYISEKAFNIGFTIFLIAMAVYMLVNPTPTKNISPSEKNIAPASYNLPLGIFISFLVGFISSMAGIGGGIVHVPAMIFLFGFPPFIAIPTSHFILAISALCGAGSHIMLGGVLWKVVPSLGVGAIIGAQLGAALSHKIRSIWLIRGLVLAILFVAVRLLLK